MWQPSPSSRTTSATEFLGYSALSDQLLTDYRLITADPAPRSLRQGTLVTDPATNSVSPTRKDS
ncbi:hypothetical protein [Nocardia sp. NPDC057030]|uniref:hypothetical protein n=1 Tax=Nocardia sp. NPDC057030 TaxID=3346005 RepID=UPI00362B3E72